MNNLNQLASIFLRKYPKEAAQVLEKQSFESLAAFFEDIPGTEIAECFKYMSRTLVTSLIEVLPDNISANILQSLPLENIMLFLRPMDRDKSLKIQEHFPRYLIDALKTKIHFPEGTAGYIMNPQILSVPMDHSISQVTEMVKQFPEYIEYYIFVTDRENKLKGFINTRQLIISDPNLALETLTQSFSTTLSPYMPYRQILISPGWFDRHALPVVDKEGTLLGAISHSYLMQIESKLFMLKGAHESESELETIGEILRIGTSGILSNFLEKKKQ